MQSPTSTTSPVLIANHVSSGSISAGGGVDGSRPRLGPASSSSPNGGSGASNKRKGEEGSTHHSSSSASRAKRNRYISIACNECKRRKIKCNGETPCQRCGNLSLECLYAPNCCSGGGFKDSDEYRQMNERMDYLQEQVNHMSQTIRAIQNQEPHPPMAHLEGSSITADDTSGTFHLRDRPSHTSGSPSGCPRRQHARHPRFQGPTSSAFSFDVAKSSLQTMGITEGDDNIDEGVATQDDTNPGSPISSNANINPLLAHPTKDPLWSIGLDEAIRLTRVYEEEMGIMYPILDIEKVIGHAKLLYRFLGAATRTGFAQVSSPGADGISDDDSNVLKLVLANALMTEGSGQSELGTRLFESAKKAADKRIWGCEIDLKGLTILVLSSMYYFHQDEEPLAWRMIGITARMCIELGLHRRDSLTKGFDTDEEQRWAIRIFWSIYSLDRRWSMGTGMPFALQDSEIDPMLPEPDDSTAYLIAMIAYGRICSKVWKTLAGLEHSNNEAKRDRIGYLDYQLLQWHGSIPESLRYLDPATGMEVKYENRGIRRLRILLYLRANQLRTIIYRPILHSATSIMENRSLAITVVDVAKETIRILYQMNQTSDIYRSQQVCFNYFLVSALAVLFLAVSHAPAQFSAVCRDEFYMALDLVRGFSSKSYISKRLWQTIKGLKEVGPKLGLLSRGNGVHGGPGGDSNGSNGGGGGSDPTDAHSSAAVAMAGLAGHNVDELAIYQQNKGLSPLGKSPLNGSQMSYELTHLFEAAGGFASNPMENSNSNSNRNSGGSVPQHAATVMGPGDGGGGGYVHNHGDQNGNGQGPGPGPPPSMPDGFTPMFGNAEEFSRIMQNLF